MNRLLALALAGSLLAMPVQAAKKKTPAPDAELDMIPDILLDTPAPEAAKAGEEEQPPKWRLTGGFEAEGDWAFRSDPPVLLPGRVSAAQRPWLGSFKLRLEGRISGNTTFYHQGRWTGLMRERDSFREAGSQYDTKELYISTKLSARHYVDLGRVNVREGVATGFNPTDFFKAGAVRTRTAEDPGKLREDRLGALMARWQWLTDAGSLSIAYAPEVDDTPGKTWTSQGDWSLGLDATNARDRLLVKYAPKWFKDDNPELLAYREAGRTRAGLNWVKGYGERTIIYGEWAAGKNGGLTEGGAGLLPAAFIKDPGKIRHQAAIGFSYTDDKKRSFWLEWQMNQGGFSGDDWRRYWNLGDTANQLRQNIATLQAGEFTAAQFWTMRQLGTSLGEPMGRHAVFMRNTWDDVWNPDTDLSAIWLFNPHDRSIFVQPRLDLKISDSHSWHMAVSGLLGKDKSEFGGLPTNGSLRIGSNWYF